MGSEMPWKTVFFAKFWEFSEHLSFINLCHKKFNTKAWFCIRFFGSYLKVFRDETNQFRNHIFIEVIKTMHISFIDLND